MKLFEQPLEKLLNQKALKQLNRSINSSSSISLSSLSTTTTTTTGSSKSYLQSTKSTSWTNTKRKRRTTTAASNLNNTATLCRFNSLSDTNNNNYSANLQRHQLELAVLPEPIRNLLNELYLRGPGTVGIFRKSPSAKHCKELRHKLEADSHSSVAEYQVNEIASVFKEWLRSLPDCLLMSRLYPQWMDVAKLIEPLYENKQQQQLTSSTSKQNLPEQDYHHSTNCDTSTSTTSTCNRLLRPPSAASSPLTDNAAAGQTTSTGASASASASADDSGCGSLASSSSTSRLPLDRSRSCVDLASNSREYHLSPISSSTPTRHQLPPETAGGLKKCKSNLLLSSAQLSERHFECLRIVRQLLDTLNEGNLILLRAFVCILWHISNNSAYNMMSACNLGVCVGQSLLNDDKHRNRSAGSSTFGFTKRHRRSTSQCLLPATLLSLMLQPPGSQRQLPKQHHLEKPLNQASTCHRPLTATSSSSAQETARYVPMLVAFFIENALALFGPDLSELFETQKTTTTTAPTTGASTTTDATAIATANKQSSPSSSSSLSQSLASSSSPSSSPSSPASSTSSPSSGTSCTPGSGRRPARIQLMSSFVADPLPPNAVAASSLKNTQQPTLPNQRRPISSTYNSCATLYHQLQHQHHQHYQQQHPQLPLSQQQHLQQQHHTHHHHINRNRDRNGNLLNWYGPYVSVITKVPKIPARLSSSSYGDSVIYNGVWSGQAAQPQFVVVGSSVFPCPKRLSCPQPRPTAVMHAWI